MNNPDTIRKLLATMKEKNSEYLHLLAVLNMWEEIKIQGYHPDDVKSFTFDPSFSNRFEMRKIGYLDWPINSSGHVICLWYNCLIFHDGSRHKLSPMIHKPE